MRAPLGGAALTRGAAVLVRWPREKFKFEAPQEDEKNEKDGEAVEVRGPAAHVERQNLQAVANT